MSAAGRRVVVTGTGTEIGKTMVACGLARALSDRGIGVRAVKPVESGTAVAERDREDGVLLARAARQDAPAEALVRLEDPLAPPVAADREGVELSMAAWTARIEELSAGTGLTLVEGAGGVLSPLTWDATARELAAALDAPALVVAPDRLGCLTHTLTALESLRAGGVEPLGVVYSAPPEEDASTGGNPETLARFSGLDRIARLGRVADFREAAGELAAVADWLEEPAERDARDEPADTEGTG